MSVVGLICAYNEAGNIGPAVSSLWAAGCDRVVVVDGAWANPDGTPFGGGPWLSSDSTADEAVAAGATVLVWPDRGQDADKLDWAINHCGAAPGDHILRLDADERATGTINPATAPSGHGCVVLHNRENDLPGVRTDWLDGAVRPSVPLLRWLRYQRDLRCVAPGRYETSEGPVVPYLVTAFARELDRRGLDNVPVMAAALAGLRDLEQHLPDELLCALPLLPDVEIWHQPEGRAERVAAKRVYYEALA